MLNELSLGTSINTVLGGSATVKSLLGEGGQGYVYKVNYNGNEMALKWYKPVMAATPVAKQFYDGLKKLVLSGPPNDHFLWPIDMTEYQEGRFGYIMPLRPSGYFELTDFLLGHTHFSSYKSVVDACLIIVTAYRALHNKGLSYQDLNDGNFFINPTNGDVLICDNDNVAPEGTFTGILGKPRYMAPEIVIDPERNHPNTLSDRYSMALIIFELFFMNHPLEGRGLLKFEALVPSAQKKIYGDEALFIMDSNDSSNAPHPKINPNVIAIWPYLPDYMQELFRRAFSQEALKNPSRRVIELDWIKALVRFRSHIVICPKCGNEVFIGDTEECQCESCSNSRTIPFSLKLRDYSLPGIPGTRIYRCQVGTCDVDEALQPVGIVLMNPAKTAIGIQNLSNRSWNVMLRDDSPKRIEPKQATGLEKDMTIEINAAASHETITVK